MRDERGSVAIEASIAIVFIGGVIGAGLTLAYVAFARVWLSRAAYEASICLSTSIESRVCRDRLVAVVARGLPIGQIERTQLQRSARAVSAEFEWKLNGARIFSISDSRRVPIRSGAFQSRWGVP